MVNKCLYLTKNSLTKKIKSKWFIIVNIILLLVVSIVLNIDNVISLFGGDFLEPTPVYVLDNSTYTYEILKTTVKYLIMVIMK